MRIRILLFMLLLSFYCEGQNIFQSKEISIRNDIYYDLLKVGSKHLILRNKSNSYIIEKFNHELQYEGSVNLELDEKKTEIILATDLDSILQIIYTYQDSRYNNIIKCIEYNENIQRIDTAKILVSSIEKFADRGYQSTISEDKLYSLLFGTLGKELRITLIDNSNKKIVYSSIFDFQNFDVTQDFRKIVLTNDGRVYVIFEKDNTKFRRENHIVGIYELFDEKNFQYKELDLSNTVNTGIQVVYNNLKSSLTLAGLFAEKDIEELIGYFIYQSTNIDSLSNFIEFSKFNNSIFEDLYGNKSRKKRNSLSDFYLKDIALRQDNGCLLISEMSREFVRRSSYSNMSGYDGNGYSNRGFVDYYNEDLLLINLNQNGEEDWNKLFYKKQFSQDDEAIYSSYFLMKTPSRLRFIYNDEIKKNSTVSEYVISPTGKFERNAIINTEYRGLQLRFSDAEQIGPNELIVPSEKDFRLSLVKLRLE